MTARSGKEEVRLRFRLPRGTCGLLRFYSGGVYINVCHALPGTHERSYINMAYAHTLNPLESFMAEGLFAPSIRSRCELGGRGDKNRAREVSETAGERRRQGQEESVRDGRRHGDLRERRAAR